MDQNPDDKNSKHRLEIDQFRKKIDFLDGVLVDTLIKRFDLIKELSKLKKDAGLGTLDRSREEEIIDGLPNQYIKNIFKGILKESKKFQRRKKE